LFEMDLLAESSGRSEVSDKINPRKVTNLSAAADIPNFSFRRRNFWCPRLQRNTGYLDHLSTRIEKFVSWRGTVPVVFNNEVDDCWNFCKSPVLAHFPVRHSRSLPKDRNSVILSFHP
jgi:hypothetical protein